MNNELDRIIDLCVDRLNRGETIEACLNDYPEQAKELEPLLRAMTQTQQSFSFIPSVDKKRAARQKLITEMEKRRNPSVLQKLLTKPAIWATVAIVAVVMVGAYFALRTTVFPNIPTTAIASPAAEGNFAFLVSDDVNAIEEFNTVNVNIDKVSLLKVSESKEWIEFTPEIREFDLSLLPGDKTQELWRGDVPAGQYDRIVIYVSSVSGTLKNGDAVTIKLPSSKMQISSSFNVSADAITSFVYDLTVIKTGNVNNIKYILKPQAGESGATQQPQTSNPSVNNGKGKSGK